DEMNSKHLDSGRPDVATISPAAAGLPFSVEQGAGSFAAPTPNWKPSGLILAAEIALAGVSFLLTSWILYDAATRSEVPLAANLFIVLAVRSVFLYWLGPFRSSLRHTGVHELLGITKAVSLSSLLIALFVNRLEIGGPESLGLIVLDWSLCQ